MLQKIILQKLKSDEFRIEIAEPTASGDGAVYAKIRLI